MADRQVARVWQSKRQLHQPRRPHVAQNCLCTCNFDRSRQHSTTACVQRALAGEGQPAICAGAGPHRAEGLLLAAPLRQHLHLPKSRHHHAHPAAGACCSASGWPNCFRTTQARPLVLVVALVSRRFAMPVFGLTQVHELCVKRIHVTKRDLFYTDVKLFEV